MQRSRVLVFSAQLRSALAWIRCPSRQQHPGWETHPHGAGIRARGPPYPAL